MQMNTLTSNLSEFEIGILEYKKSRLTKNNGQNSVTSAKYFEEAQSLSHTFSIMI